MDTSNPRLPRSPKCTSQTCNPVGMRIFVGNRGLCPIFMLARVAMPQLQAPSSRHALLGFFYHDASANDLQPLLQLREEPALEELA